MAPGHPPIVNITTSHKLSSNVFAGATLVMPTVGLVSNNLGKNTLNIVKARYKVMVKFDIRVTKRKKHQPSDMKNHAPQTKMVVLNHSGDSTVITRSHHAESGLLNLHGNEWQTCFS
jgi:hypothetical protein